MGRQVTYVPFGTRQTYGKMANLLFQSLGCLRVPRGPVIKTKTSQHSTMKAPYLQAFLFRQRVRAARMVDVEPATTRKLPSIVVDSWNKGKWQNRKLELDDLPEITVPARRVGHKAAEWKIFFANSVFRGTSPSFHRVHFLKIMPEILLFHSRFGKRYFCSILLRQCPR